MEKYVAFIDILGFKEKLKGLTQGGAEEFIKSFSSMLYREWELNNLQLNANINGYIVSDSIILYTKDDSKDSLFEMLNYLMKIFKRAFSEKGILLRGGIAKGEFNWV